MRRDRDTRDTANRVGNVVNAVKHNDLGGTVKNTVGTGIDAAKTIGHVMNPLSWFYTRRAWSSLAA